MVNVAKLVLPGLEAVSKFGCILGLSEYPGGLLLRFVEKEPDEIAVADLRIGCGRRSVRA